MNSQPESSFSIVPGFWKTKTATVARVILNNLPREKHYLLQSHRKGEPIVAIADTKIMSTPFGSFPSLYFSIGTRDAMRSGKNLLAAHVVFDEDLILDPDWLETVAQQDTLYASLCFSTGEEIHVRLLEPYQMFRLTDSLKESVTQSVLCGAEFNLRKAVDYSEAEGHPQDVINFLVRTGKSLYGVDHQTLVANLWALIRGVDGTYFKELLDFYTSDEREGKQFLPRSGDPLIENPTAMGWLWSEYEEENLIADWYYTMFANERGDVAHRGFLVSYNHLTFENRLYSPIPYWGKPRTPADLISVARQYRYVAPMQAHHLIDFKTEYLIPIDESLLRYDFGFKLSQQDMEFARKTLVAASIEQEFAIDRPTQVLFGLPGCIEITYAPLVGGSMGFKILVERTKARIDHVLLGQLVAEEGKIRIIGISEGTKTDLYLDSLQVIVALAYRDLVVARHRYVRATSTQKGFSSDRSSKSAKVKAPIRLLPRVKTITLDSRSVTDLREVIREIAPHYRSPTLRRLPEGHHASLSRIQAAKKLGWNVPDGKTFVRGTVVGNPSAEEADSIQKYRSTSLIELLLNGGKPSDIPMVS